MSSEVKANKISPATGTALQISDSGDTTTIPSGATLDVNGTLDVTGATVTGLSAGKVLQIVESKVVNPSGNLTTTSASLVAIGAPYEIAITPSATGSKVLVQFQVSQHYTGGSAYQSVFSIYRDIGGAGYSELTTGADGIHQSQSSNWQYFLFQYLDSPSTTSACTYKLYWYPKAGTTSYIQEHSMRASYAWEIGA